MRPDPGYQALLESLADGAAIDWTAFEADAASDVDRRRYRNLRLVARVAELHRTILAEEAGAAAGPGRTPTSRSCMTLRSGTPSCRASSSRG